MEINPTTPTTRFVGTCEPCRRPVAVENATTVSDIDYVACAECARSVRLDRIYGTIAVDCPCDASCVSAKGSECVCACGGFNHGAGFVVRHGESTLPAIAAYRARRNKVDARTAERRESKAAAERQARQSVAEAFAAENPDVVAYLGAHAASGQYNEFLDSLIAQQGRKGTLSEAQVAAVRRNIQRDADRAARQAAEALEPKVDAPEGRVTVTGTVVHTCVREGFDGWVSKMIVKADGFKVWSTIPTALQAMVGYVDEALQGRTVTFTATLSRSDTDASFAFAKRPTKVVLAPAAPLALCEA